MAGVTRKTGYAYPISAHLLRKKVGCIKFVVLKWVNTFVLSWNRITFNCVEKLFFIQGLFFTAVDVFFYIPPSLYCIWVFCLIIVTQAGNFIFIHVIDIEQCEHFRILYSIPFDKVGTKIL